MMVLVGPIAIGAIWAPAKGAAMVIVSRISAVMGERSPVMTAGQYAANSRQTRALSPFPARQRSAARQIHAGGDQGDAEPIGFAWPLAEERYGKQCRQRRHQSAKRRAP